VHILAQKNESLAECCSKPDYIQDTYDVTNVRTIIFNVYFYRYCSYCRCILFDIQSWYYVL